MRLMDRVLLSRPVIGIGRWRSSIDHYIYIRKSRPWTAMVSVPLAINATALLGMWWAFPVLCICAWWWADRAWPWTWLVAVESSAFGTLWAYSGANALAEFASARFLVAILWISLPLCLAATSIYTRHRLGALPDYPGY